MADGSLLQQGAVTMFRRWLAAVEGQTLLGAGAQRKRNTPDMSRHWVIDRLSNVTTRHRFGPLPALSSQEG